MCAYSDDTANRELFGKGLLFRYSSWEHLTSLPCQRSMANRCCAAAALLACSHLAGATRASLRTIIQSTFKCNSQLGAVAETENTQYLRHIDFYGIFGN